jgi:hypothetical protein
VVNNYLGRAETEREIQMWVKQFIAEVDRIEKFYVTNHKELKKEFKQLEA